MSTHAALDTSRRPALSVRAADLGKCVVVALLVLLLHASAGFPTLDAFNGDNDSLLRLVQIRDLLGGQGWFDPYQYRMGLDGGFAMHWSRLVDLPIALLVMAATALTGSPALGEAAALTLWPALLFVVTLFCLVRTTRALAGEHAVLPALVIAGAALYFIGIFAPGAIDHHNVQLALAATAICLLAVDGGRMRTGAGAGAAAAAMLAIGMEAVGYVAAAGAIAAIDYAVRGAVARRSTQGFGLAFAAVSGLAFVATLPPSRWGEPACDAFSVAQFGLAALSGLGLAGLAAMRPNSTARRFAGLSLLGIVIAAGAVLFVPQCLRDPYAALDPMLKQYWLSAVKEAQPFWHLLGADPAMAVAYYATAFIGLGLVLRHLARQPRDRTAAIVAAFLAAAVLVSLWQVRGAMFSIPFATIPLAAWIGGVRVEGAPLRMAAAWLLSLNVAWSGAANAVEGALATPGEQSAEAASACEDAAAYADLAALAPARILAISNLGAPILRYTHHSVLAGPYHRNIAGNLAALKAMMGPTGDAETILRENRIDMVAVCRGNDETFAIRDWAPDGFLATLARGDVPAWLRRIDTGDSGAAITLYRVVPHGAAAAISLHAVR